MKEKPLQLQGRLIDAVRSIEISPRRMAVVVDADNHLVGTITDGDVRRYLLAGGGLDAALVDAMNTAPISAYDGSPEEYIKDLMRGGNVVAIPIVNHEKKFLRLVHLIDLVSGQSDSDIPKAGFSFAVIMAGGEGARLRPLTQAIPKPMVEIGGVPLLQRQIEKLARGGISRIYISVNYLGHIIEDYFGDGSDFGVEVFYLRENEKLGTAGALSLLPEHPLQPIIVMNGDILTSSDFMGLYQFHCAHSANITVAAIDYRVNIPFGVIRADGPFASGLVEKPSERFLCNAGIYVLSPNALNALPKNIHCNMTDLIEVCLAKKFPVAVFPVHEYWTDIGTPDELEKARTHFEKMEINK